MKSTDKIRLMHSLAKGLCFGLVFGFLLQKGGVGKYHILMGQLLLRDWTVVKIMGSAILIGMPGVYFLRARGLVELHVKETRLGANTVGGLIFGLGFGLSGYCPGTNLTALGQGNWDALTVAAGLMAGSYLYAEMSDWLNRTIGQWGNMGHVTVPGLLGARETIVVSLTALGLIILLFILETLV